jgi:hypothetical protein
MPKTYRLTRGPRYPTQAGTGEALLVRLTDCRSPAGPTDPGRLSGGKAAGFPAGARSAPRETSRRDNSFLLKRPSGATLS